MTCRRNLLARPFVLCTVILVFFWTKCCNHDPSCSSINSLALRTLTSASSAHLLLTSQRRVPVIKLSNCYLCLLLLVASADINPNPGPATSTSSASYVDTTEAFTYYPCGTCHRQVTWEDQAVCCEECYCWYHTDCHNIHTVTYENMKISSASWTCEKCGKVNYSQHAFQSSIRCFGDLTANQYFNISDEMNSTQTLVCQCTHRLQKNPSNPVNLLDQRRNEQLGFHWTVSH